MITAAGHRRAARAASTASAPASTASRGWRGREEDAACRAWFEDQAVRDRADAWRAIRPGTCGRARRRSRRGGGSARTWTASAAAVASTGRSASRAAFEIAASSPHPIAVISFADEEGARFNTPTFGSKALAGKLDVTAILSRRDDARRVGRRRDARRRNRSRRASSTRRPGARACRGCSRSTSTRAPTWPAPGPPVGIVSALAARAAARGRASRPRRSLRHDAAGGAPRRAWPPPRG